ncbi:MAG: RluA family pseudouridine synthase [Nitrosomonas sp.]|nr:MAG: RluA family pseudouridine synthase [Nitrosomonas sp.]
MPLNKNAQRKSDKVIAVTEKIVGEEGVDQRVDNYLFKRLKHVPKSHVYQLIRSGQVRVNSKRINASYRLHPGDLVRIPPVRYLSQGPAKSAEIPAHRLFSLSILYEDDALLIINKPGGVAVHGGSGISFGVIEQLRGRNPAPQFLELVHRLDRETSGVLMLAKKRSALVELHRQIREGAIEKHYSAMVSGQWRNRKQHVKLPLDKYVTASGERRVTVSTSEQTDNKSMSAHTIFTLQRTWKMFSLLDAELKTGRTHQIRVHLAHLGFPILGDDKYGDFDLNKRLTKTSVDNSGKLMRMFLHASTLRFTHPLSGEGIMIEAPLPPDLQEFIGGLRE